MMRRVLAFAIAAWALPRVALASGGEAGALQHRVETANLSSTDLWLAVLYNDHRLAYAALTTASMAVFGLVIGAALDTALGQLGLRAARGARRE